MIILSLAALVLVVCSIAYKIRNRKKKRSDSFFGEDSFDDIFYSGLSLRNNKEYKRQCAAARATQQNPIKRTK